MISRIGGRFKVMSYKIDLGAYTSRLNQACGCRTMPGQVEGASSARAELQRPLWAPALATRAGASARVVNKAYFDCQIGSWLTLHRGDMLDYNYLGEEGGN